MEVTKEMRSAIARAITEAANEGNNINVPLDRLVVLNKIVKFLEGTY